jgi:hypothetical protein
MCAEECLHFTGTLCGLLQNMEAVAYPEYFFRGGRGGSTNSAEDRGQREVGSGGSNPLIIGFTQFVIERNPYSD